MQTVVASGRGQGLTTFYFNYDGSRLKHNSGEGSGKRLERAE